MSRFSGEPVLVVMALELEAQGLFETGGVSVLFTGVGKVNAAYRLTRRLAELHSDGVRPLVVNFGTAGSPVHGTGSLVSCHRFVQRDMDVTGLGFRPGETPFEETPRILEFEPVFEELPASLCASGDSFETKSGAGAAEHGEPIGVFDMEAYALAKVCRLEGLPFACVKFVSDGADAQAAESWQSMLPVAARAFWDLHQGLVAPPR